MKTIALRRPIDSDIDCFRRWWKDKTLIALTSGNFATISDADMQKYFSEIMQAKKDYHFIITKNDKSIGHISLSKRFNDYYELQIVIGEKEYLGKGYGPDAIKILLNFIKKYDISKIFLEVRPTNIRAIKSYEKCSFKPIRVIKYPKNKFLPETLRMELIN